MNLLFDLLVWFFSEVLLELVRVLLVRPVRAGFMRVRRWWVRRRKA